VKARLRREGARHCDLFLPLAHSRRTSSLARCDWSDRSQPAASWDSCGAVHWHPTEALLL